MAPPPTFPARITATRMLSPQVRELTLERREPLTFEAGQWVSLVLPEELRRSYSIASAPDGTGRFEVAVTRVEGGPGSTWLHAATVGTELDVVGPQGVLHASAGEDGPLALRGDGHGHHAPPQHDASRALATGRRAASLAALRRPHAGRPHLPRRARCARPKTCPGARPLHTVARRRLVDGPHRVRPDACLRGYGASSRGSSAGRRTPTSAAFTGWWAASAICSGRTSASRASKSTRNVTTERQ